MLFIIQVTLIMSLNLLRTIFIVCTSLDIDVLVKKPVIILDIESF